MTPSLICSCNINTLLLSAIILFLFLYPLDFCLFVYFWVAYLRRGDYNVFTVDWEPLTIFPCYLSSLSNTRLVAQCAAMLYSHVTHQGGLAKKTTCVGHSLGAHICGMMSNHLTFKQYKIIGTWTQLFTCVFNGVFDLLHSHRTGHAHLKLLLKNSKVCMISLPV